MITDLFSDYLASQGLGTVAENIFVGYAPSSPDNILVLYPTGGNQADGKLGYDEPTFQVYVRNTNTASGFAHVMRVYNELQGLHNVTLSGVLIVNTLAIQSNPTLMGNDENNRAEYVQNYQVIMKNVTKHRV